MRYLLLVFFILLGCDDTTKRIDSLSNRVSFLENKETYQSVCEELRTLKNKQLGKYGDYVRSQVISNGNDPDCFLITKDDQYKSETIKEAVREVQNLKVYFFDKGFKK